MTLYEGYMGPEQDPIKNEAYEFCDALRHAIGIAAAFQREPSHDNWLRLEEAQKYIGELSPRPHWGHKPEFQLKITPRGDIQSHISRNMEVIRDNPGPTIVDAVDAIRTDEVVFYIHEEEKYLVIFGHEMEIEPVFSDEGSEESQPESGQIDN